MKYFLVLLVMFTFVFETQGARVLRATGDTTVQKMDGYIPLKKGDPLEDGENIQTGKKSLLIVKLDNGAVIKLNENSKMRIKDKPKADINLDVGSMFAKFKKNKKADRELKVITRSAVAGVRGTEFFASYGSKKKGKDDLWLCVNEGEVEVKNTKTGSKVAVKKGEGIQVAKGKETSKPKPLAWTKKLNWNMDPEAKEEELENKVDIESAYLDLLDQDYD